MFFRASFTCLQAAVLPFAGRISNFCKNRRVVHPVYPRPVSIRHTGIKLKHVKYTVNKAKLKTEKKKEKVVKHFSSFYT